MIHSAHSNHIQVLQYQWQFSRWARGFHHWLIIPPTDPLNLVNPDNACTLRITAAAGTELAGAYSSATVKQVHVLAVPCRKKKFTTLRLSSFTRSGCVKLSPIAQYSSLLPPVGVWPVSQCQCGGSSFQTPYLSSPWWASTSPTS